MPYLMQIDFDNSNRLKHKSYLFEYRGTRFKLVQNDPLEWADHLLTVLDLGSLAERETVFAIASEYLSALAWETDARVQLWEAGGRSWPTSKPVSEAEPNIFSFPRIPHGMSKGYSIDSISDIQTEEQRIALALYREASASNSDFLSLLFLWQVLEVRGEDAVDFANAVQCRRPEKLNLVSEALSELPLTSERPLGWYLREECRNAIAHIRRSPNRRSLRLDRLAERNEMTRAAQVARALAKLYISERLDLTERLWLRRPSEHGFPVYLPTSDPRYPGYLAPEKERR